MSHVQVITYNNQCVYINDWPYVSLDWIDNGRYSVTNVKSGLVWHVMITEDEEPDYTITQETWENLDCQKWDFTSLGNGYFVIMNALGGLAAHGLDDSTLDDATLNLYPFSGYHVEKTNVGDFVISGKNDDHVVEVSGASVSTGAHLALNDYDGNDHQRFYLTPADIAINSPPIISITSPSDGQTFSSGSSITIDAVASDSDGTVVLVEFYNGTTKLGEIEDSPYSYTCDNVAVGTHALIVKAIDNDGAVTAAGVNVTVSGRGPSR